MTISRKTLKEASNTFINKLWQDYGIDLPLFPLYNRETQIVLLVAVLKTKGIYRR